MDLVCFLFLGGDFSRADTHVLSSVRLLHKSHDITNAQSTLIWRTKLTISIPLGTNQHAGRLTALSTKAGCTIWEIWAPAKGPMGIEGPSMIDDYLRKLAT